MGTTSEEGRQDATDSGPALAMRVIELDAYYGARRVLKAINLDIRARMITALIGPSGAGKSTLLRCLNRLHELVPGGSVHGTVLLGAESIYDPGVDPVQVRRRIGMVFQRAVPFPTMSIADNVTAGLRLTERLPHHDSQAIVERALTQAVLWDEVKDRLHAPATALSGGQQQRLTIARALAVQPEVLLMDEPASALDPIATARIEDLIRELRAHYTIVIVTHNMQEATRVAERTAFLTVDEDGAGILVEEGPTTQVFGTPRDQRTRDYIAGRFG